MIALTARNFGKLPSELLKIEDETDAFSFDLACSYRLAIYDQETETDRFKALQMMLVGKGDEAVATENVTIETW